MGMKILSFTRLVLLAIALAPALPGKAAENRQPIAAGDIEIFYGVIPASVLLAHPADHPERTMHGGIKITSNTYHLLISIFDTKKRERITDAQMHATVRKPRLAPQTKPLETMPMAGVINYGNYFTISEPGTYRITLDINRSGSVSPIQATFDYVHR